MFSFSATCLHAGDENDAVEAASIISAFMANCESLETYDVLIRYQTFHFDGEGEVHDETHFSRVIVDRPKSKCFIVTSASRVVSGGTKDKPVEAKQTSLISAMLSDDQGWIGCVPRKLTLRCRKLPGHVAMSYEDSTLQLIWRASQR